MISKRQAIEALRILRSGIRPIPQNEIALEAIDCALTEIGRCSECYGTGSEIKAENKQPGYKKRIDPKGRDIYVYPCEDCEGTGKQLNGMCRSCGVAFDVAAGQRHVRYCCECEHALLRSGVLK